MALFAAIPLAAEQVAEDAPLHLVLRIDAQECRYPPPDIAQGQLKHHDAYEHGAGQRERLRATMCDARRHVDNLFSSPDEGEVESHTHQSADGIDGRLQLHLAEYLQEPGQKLSSTISTPVLHLIPNP